jgi:large subunit ribosomal protein L35
LFCKGLFTFIVVKNKVREVRSMKKKKKNRLKTKRALVRRFKITATGKILHKSSNTGCGHLRRKKTKSTRRRQKLYKEIPSYAYKTLINILPS